MLNLNSLKHLIVFLVISLPLFVFTQNDDIRVLDSAECSVKMDSLLELYGHNKNIPENYKLSFLLALSHYNELDSIKIKFKSTKIKTTLNARPTVPSLLFRRTAKRTYVIRINDKASDSLILLDAVPFNARVGLFGHELCHFADYNQKSIFGVMGRMFAYSSLKKKEKFEKEIDSLTIERGLGWQLYDWSDFVLNESVGSVEYKDFKRKVYLEPDEIEVILEGRIGN